MWGAAKLRDCRTQLRLSVMTIIPGRTRAQPKMKKTLCGWFAECRFHQDTDHCDRLRLTTSTVGHQSHGEMAQALGPSKPRTIWNQARRSSRKALENHIVASSFFMQIRSMWVGSLPFQPVADAANRLQPIGVGSELLPQAMHMRIHGSGIADELVAPDLIQQLLPGQNPAGGFDQ